jgi:hypothetical protein
MTHDRPLFRLNVDGRAYFSNCLEEIGGRRDECYGTSTVVEVPEGTAAGCLHAKKVEKLGSVQHLSRLRQRRPEHLRPAQAGGHGS